MCIFGGWVKEIGLEKMMKFCRCGDGALANIFKCSTSNAYKMNVCPYCCCCCCCRRRWSQAVGTRTHKILLPSLQRHTHTHTHEQTPEQDRATSVLRSDDSRYWFSSSIPTTEIYPCVCIYHCSTHHTTLHSTGLTLSLTQERPAEGWAVPFSVASM